MPSPRTINRRNLLSMMAFGTAAWQVPGAFAEQLTRTPRQVEGPFYPDKLPLDTDNDLIVVNDRTTPAVGTITHLSGRVLDASGSPVRNATVELWQCDAEGAYLHSQGAPKDKRDKNFQGFGRFLTGRNGRYAFRTIKPVSYPGRTPHIHFIVQHRGKRVLTTQLYVKDEPMNARDILFRRTPAKDRPLLLADFKPIENSKIGELAANWDIVIGRTPADAE